MTETSPRSRRHPARLVVLAVVALVLPSAVLGSFGMFHDHSVEPAGFSWSMAAWLVAPYVALAALCLWASRSRVASFRTAVAVTTTIITAQSVLLSAVTLSDDQDLAAVGVLFSPVLYLGAAAVLLVVGLVQHLTSGARAVTVPVALPSPRVSPGGRS